MEFKESNDKIWLENEEGKTVAYVEFPEIAAGVHDVAHTVVDSSLRGQGIAGKLLEALVKKAEKEGKRLQPTCSYAVGWFEKHEEYSHLLKDEKK